MWCEEIFTGLDYQNFPKCTTIENGMAYDEMISCKASVMSCCEHHLVPFIGICYAAYIPNEKVVGLSKINRIVDFFSRRPQVQERLTLQISETLRYILKTDDVAVVIKAEHMCVKLRGVKDAASETITSKMSGKFLSNPSLRAEFLSLTR
jgi:GTP cyclohydrolase I